MNNIPIYTGVGGEGVGGVGLSLSNAVGNFDSNGFLIEGSGPNLIDDGSAFDDNSWSKSNSLIIADSSTAPDGSMTMDAIRATSTNAEEKRVQQTANSSPINTLVYSIVNVKKGAEDFVFISLYDGTLSKAARAYFDLTNGTVGSITNSGSPVDPFFEIHPAANGSYKIIVGLINSEEGGCILRVSTALSNNTKNYASADTTSDLVYLWGAEVKEL